MLGFPIWYYQTLRRTITVFGTLFKDTTVAQFNANTREEIQRVTVPLYYGGKDEWVTRLYGDPTLHKGIQVSLPSMSFEMTTLKYDPARRTSPYMTRQLSQVGSNNMMTFAPAVPYDLGFNLYLYVRNQEDGTQVIEQILPLFTPDYTLNVQWLVDDTCAVSEDLPFVFDGVNYDNNYEGPAGPLTDATVRHIVWTLAFTAKIWLYGPVTQSGMINEVIVNLRSNTTNAILSTITVTPNANTVITSSDYGFTTSIVETD